MRQTPQIDPLGGGHDFHDSSLIDVHVSPKLNQIRFVLSTPDESRVERLWMITCLGVLRFEYETVGSGIEPATTIPLEIYEIYNKVESEERERWVSRLLQLDVPRREAQAVWHLVLASSFARGWGVKDSLEGLHVICRDVTVEPAPRDYQGSEFSRPRIEADE